MSINCTASIVRRLFAQHISLAFARTEESCVFVFRICFSEGPPTDISLRPRFYLHRKKMILFNNFFIAGWYTRRKDSRRKPGGEYLFQDWAPDGSLDKWLMVLPQGLPFLKRSEKVPLASRLGVEALKWRIKNHEVQKYGRNLPPDTIGLSSSYPLFYQLLCIIYGAMREVQETVEHGRPGAKALKISHMWESWSRRWEY